MRWQAAPDTPYPSDKKVILYYRESLEEFLSCNAIDQYQEHGKTVKLEKRSRKGLT